MSLIGRWLSGALSFWRKQQDENLHWHSARQQAVANLRHHQAMAEQSMLAELKKQAQQLEHELSIAKAQNSNELAMVKIQCQQELKDYQQYLASLDKLKESLRNSYDHLPEAVAFTVHHHAKQLLNRMWAETDAEEKLRIEMELLQFMTAVHEDSLTALNKAADGQLPQKALAFIEAKS